jgi:hypothetical protein
VNSRVAEPNRTSFVNSGGWGKPADSMYRTKSPVRARECVTPQSLGPVSRAGDLSVLAAAIARKSSHAWQAECRAELADARGGASRLSLVISGV